jgi:hypothetical protein
MNAICIILLYILYMLYLFGVEMIFWFKVIAMICIASLIISFLKAIMGFPVRKQETSRFWNYYYCIAVFVGSVMMCAMFTAVASWKIKGLFFLCLSMLLLAALIRNFYVRTTLLFLLSAGYGVVLAKWYQVNPLDGRFGIFSDESVGIVLSAVMIILPILILCHKECCEKQQE